MRNQDTGRPSDHKENMLHEGQEIDYSPKTYNIGETLLFGMKLFGIAALFFILLWIAEKYIRM